MVINTALKKCQQRKKENNMSNINKIYKKVSELNAKAKEKGFTHESFMMIQSDGETISFYGYFFETQTRKIDEYDEFIKKDLENLEYFLDNMNLI
jgi:hypothetical protein